MFEVVCQKCGAVFTSPNSKVPGALTCMCNCKEFKVMEKLALAA